MRSVKITQYVARGEEILGKWDYTDKRYGFAGHSADVLIWLEITWFPPLPRIVKFTARPETSGEGNLYVETPRRTVKEVSVPPYDPVSVGWFPVGPLGMVKIRAEWTSEADQYVFFTIENISVVPGLGPIYTKIPLAPPTPKPLTPPEIPPEILIYMKR
jgi:hypothetical protein